MQKIHTHSTLALCPFENTSMQSAPAHAASGSHALKITVLGPDL